MPSGAQWGAVWVDLGSKNTVLNAYFHCSFWGHEPPSISTRPCGIVKETCLKSMPRLKVTIF
jgi:hypothetical protein